MAKQQNGWYLYEEDISFRKAVVMVDYTFMALQSIVFKKELFAITSACLGRYYEMYNDHVPFAYVFLAERHKQEGFRFTLFPTSFLNCINFTSLTNSLPNHNNQAWAKPFSLCPPLFPRTKFISMGTCTFYIRSYIWQSCNFNKVS